MVWRVLIIKHKYSEDRITEWAEKSIRGIKSFYACYKCKKFENYLTKEYVPDMHEQPFIFNPEPNIIKVKIAYQITTGDHYCKFCIEELENSDPDWALGLYAS